MYFHDLETHPERPARMCRLFRGAGPGYIGWRMSSLRADTHENMQAARQDAAVEAGDAPVRVTDGEAFAATRYRAERIKFWNGYVRKPASSGYYRRLAE